MPFRCRKSRSPAVTRPRPGYLPALLLQPEQLIGQPRSLFLKGCAAALQGHHLFCKVLDSACGILRADSARMNVGDEVSVRVRVSRAGRIGHVRRETLRGGKTRPLPDQQYDHTGRKKLADIVHDADAGVPHDKRLSIGQSFVVRYSRVGIMNDIGELLAPRVIVLLIGERPGLATAESLSAYMAYSPRPGNTDADR